MLATVAQAVALSMDRLPVLGETAAAPQPCEGAFDDPAPGQQHEAFGGIRSLDDFQGPASMAFDAAFEFVAGISAIGEDMAQPREPEADGFENIDGAVAVLNVRGVDQDEQQKADWCR